MSWPPKKNQSVSLEVVVRDANGDIVTTGNLSSVTIQNGVAAAGPTPTFVAGGGGAITISLSAGQNNFDRMALIISSDASGAKSAYRDWFNVVNQMDDLPTFAQFWTTALTESYAAVGAAPTPAEFFHMLYSVMAQAKNVGTQHETQKLDGATKAMGFTLDDANNATSRTRTS